LYKCLFNRKYNKDSNKLFEKLVHPCHNQTSFDVKSVFEYHNRMMLQWN